MQVPSFLSSSASRMPAGANEADEWMMDRAASDGAATQTRKMEVGEQSQTTWASSRHWESCISSRIFSTVPWFCWPQPAAARCPERRVLSLVRLRIVTAPSTVLDRWDTRAPTGSSIPDFQIPRFCVESRH